MAAERYVVKTSPHLGKGPAKPAAELRRDGRRYRVLAIISGVGIVASFIGFQLAHRAGLDQGFLAAFSMMLILSIIFASIFGRLTGVPDLALQAMPYQAAEALIVENQMIHFPKSLHRRAESWPLAYTSVKVVGSSPLVALELTCPEFEPRMIAAVALTEPVHDVARELKRLIRQARREIGAPAALGTGADLDAPIGWEQPTSAPVEIPRDEP